MKLRAVRCIEFVAAIRRTRGNHADRRRRRFHRANLHGGSVGSQKSAVRQIKRVLFIAGGMVWRRVQSNESVPFGFDIGSFRQSEAHSSKNLNSSLVHLMERMQRTSVMWRSRKRDVDARERAGFFVSTNFFYTLIERGVNAVTRLVE